MDELSRALLHGTSGLQAAEDAASGDLGAALREQAISEWAADRPVSRPVQPYRGPGSSFRFRAWLVVACVIALALVILIN